MDVDEKQSLLVYFKSKRLRVLYDIEQILHDIVQHCPINFPKQRNYDDFIIGIPIAIDD